MGITMQRGGDFQFRSDQSERLRGRSIDKTASSSSFFLSFFLRLCSVKSNPKFFHGRKAMASQLYVLGEERYGRETGKGNLVLCYAMHCRGIVKRGCGDYLHILKPQYRYTMMRGRLHPSVPGGLP